MSDWFRPKRYGYGATPSNWKGWFATALFAAFIFGMSQLIAGGFGPASAGVNIVLRGLVVIATVLFVWIAWKKTDGTWRWRWGSSGKEK